MAAKTTKRITGRKTTKKDTRVSALTVVNDRRYEKTEETKALHTEISEEDWKKQLEENETPKLAFENGLTNPQLDTIADAIDKQMTPSQYFNILKDIKGKLTKEELTNLIENAMDAMETFKLTGQKSLAENVMRRLQLALKERNAVINGYDQVINRIDLEVWLHNIHEGAKKSDDKKQPIHIIELERYQRTIPDDVIDKLKDAKKYFEKFFIVFTDYTGESVRTVEKEKRDKDPVLFGAFMTKTKGGNLRPSAHLFFIADWIDDQCDLTFEQIMKEYKKSEKREMTIPYEQLMNASPEELNEYFKMPEE